MQQYAQALRCPAEHVPSDLGRQSVKDLRRECTLLPRHRQIVNRSAPWLSYRKRGHAGPDRTRYQQVCNF